MPKGIPKLGMNKGWFKQGHSRKHTDDEKRKIGLSNSIALKGRKQSEISNEKRRRTLKGKNKGERNGNWKGGTTYNPYGYEFTYRLRWLIRKRDNLTCQECYKEQDDKKIFAVHHIDYDKRNNDINNLITLCNHCHGKTTYTKKVEYYKMRYQEKVQRL